ncbi:ABC transporter ATP-binding protein [Candidatus Chloroploca sp. M-50]|uniref:ABC transporter ATP-binding protein n=1 Tax=Candidatus Chloroploca mongolica TaxID=2528176 RepID=A0ABS4DBD4_9CHLR|nr:ABC transporter ATP-binding protein [Candidatus Chloroploca mongolica]MBP1466759.1 ABC transporter ATP-binding protein [Candidatus Chloroploca mongolica]
MSQVSCEGLSKAFGPTYAVEQVSMTIQPGEILALLGPSGCGKTTVLRMLAGFEAPDQGTIALDQRLVARPGLHVPPEERHVGMVFQQHALFPHLNVGQNVGFGLRGKARERQAQVQAMLKLVELDGYERRMPHQLSGGQQQRVALARALAPNPAVLLLDEPFSNLDADLRTTLRAQVRTILKQLGTTALFVTHDQEEALFMGDRIAVMHAGRLEQLARPQELFLAPATRFIAEFIGIAAFIPATVTPAGLATELGTVIQAIDAPVGTSVDMLVRPDDLELSADPQGNARILCCTFRGGDFLYDVALASQRTLRCVCNHVHEFAPDTRVQVTLAPGHPLAWFHPIPQSMVNLPK